MPIRPEHCFFYPIDWAQLSAVIRFGRARGCCEGCGRPHGRMVYHLGDGRWWDAGAGQWRDGWGRRIRIARDADKWNGGGLGWVEWRPAVASSLPHRNGDDRMKTAALALALTLAGLTAAVAQTTPNANNNNTPGSPNGGAASGNGATGSGAAPSGK